MLGIHTLAFVITTHLALAGCGHAADDARTSQGGAPMRDTTSGAAKATTPARVQMVIGGQAVIVRMHDNATSRDFLSMLPLTVQLSDYAATEKVASLPRKLSLTGAPSGFDPSVGDLTYYSPWGNLAFFYKDFRYSSGLVPLGVVESGMDALKGVTGEVSVTIERVTTP